MDGVQKTGRTCGCRMVDSAVGLEDPIAVTSIFSKAFAGVSINVKSIFGD